jgi:phosphoglycolate phosphatase
MAAIFLDLDGTLTDPKPGITGAVRHALRALGLPVPDADALEWVIGPPLLDSFARLGASDPHAALAIYREHYMDHGLFDARVYDGIPDAIETLANAGHRLFLATAKPHVYAVRITAHFGLDARLEAQFGPELDGTLNDKGELLRHALGLTGLDGADAIMVGDRDVDLRSARVNKMRFVGALWGYGTAAELDGADIGCARPVDLAAGISALTGRFPRKAR